jgi:hypothetical protein
MQPFFFGVPSHLVTKKSTVSGIKKEYRTFIINIPTIESEALTYLSVFFAGGLENCLLNQSTA